MAASLPSNLTPAQFTAATGSAPTPTLTAPQLATQNAVQAQNASPAGAVQTPYNFVPVNSVQTSSNGSPTTINGVSLPSGTLNANISTPASNSTVVAPPAVITSASAQNDLNNMQTQVGQLNQDVANHQQINQNNAANTAAAQSQNQNSNSGSGDTSNSNNSNSNNGSSNTGVPSLDDQINSLLSDLNSNTQAVNQDAQNNEGGLLSAEDQNQQAQNAAYAQTASQLQAIASGTYPLSASEQQLLTATASQFQTAIQQQQMANQNAVASAQMTGLATNSSGEAISLMQNAITNGNLAVTKINAQMATSVATLQQGFQKQDFDMIQSAWQDSAKQFEDRQSELQNMLTTVQSAATQQEKEIQDNTTTALSAIMDSNTISYQAKQQAFQQAQLSETTRHDMVDEMDSRYQYSDGMVFDKMTGQATPANIASTGASSTTPGQTGITLLDSNTKTTSTGVPYIDATNYTAAQAASMSQIAANLNIPFIGKTQAPALANIDAVRSDIQNIQDAYEQVAPSNVIERGINTIGNPISSFLQIGSNSAGLNSYAGYRSAAIKAIQSLAGTGSGNRINVAEINTMMNNVPNPNDSQATAKAKLAVLSSMINAGEKSIFGTSVYDQYNPDSATSDLKSYASASPDHQTQVAQIHAAYPQLSADQVLQLVQP